MQTIRFGIDLAKNVFQVHGVDAAGQVVVQRQLRRGQMLTFFARQPAALIGMEACGSPIIGAVSCKAWAMKSD
jgi:transposase